MMKTKKPARKTSSSRSNTTRASRSHTKWHGVDFHHPIHSLQNSHPAVFVAFLLGLYVTYIITFAAIADVVGHVK